jgi:hypothetical protein
VAYDSRVYRILIASPSDVEEEREIAVRVIQEWNDLYSHSRRIVLLPLRWETHTAPEFGMRPQEVINRAIVDQCDLLVGVFWTRIGSPTGQADSGTLEEIERVGKAEKPIMLYFSKVPIDPETIDLQQNETLKGFKAKSYPKGLVESYKSIIEFRDKFAKQLELKVRDLQKADEAGRSPLSVNFISPDGNEIDQKEITQTIELPMVKSLDEVPNEHRDIVRAAAQRQIRADAAIPLALAVGNSSSSGIRNVYLELDIQVDSPTIEVSETEFSRPTGATWTTFVSSSWISGSAKRFRFPKGSRFENFDSDHLQKTEGGWKISVEWEAIQPQRVRLLKPVLHLFARESASVVLRCRIFADSFGEPYEIRLGMKVVVQPRELELTEILPNWKEIVERETAEAKGSTTFQIG